MTTNFEPKTKEQWRECVASKDPAVRSEASSVLKAAAASNGHRTSAYIAKTGEEKVEIIWEYQQRVNPLSGGDSKQGKPAAEKQQDDFADEEFTEEGSSGDEEAKEEAPNTKAKKSAVERVRKAAAKVAARESGGDSEEKATPAVDLGPVMAELSALRETCAAQTAALEDQGKVLKAIISRLSELDKWAQETHFLARLAVIVAPDGPDMLADEEVLNEYLGIFVAGGDEGND